MIKTPNAISKVRTEMFAIKDSTYPVNYGTDKMPMYSQKYRNKLINYIRSLEKGMF